MTSDQVAELEKLAALRTAGALSDDEFTRLKENLLRPKAEPAPPTVAPGSVSRWPGAPNQAPPTLNERIIRKLTSNPSAKQAEPQFQRRNWWEVSNWTMALLIAAVSALLIAAILISGPNNQPITSTSGGSSGGARGASVSRDSAGVMPDVVCTELQNAQDRIQAALSLFFVRSVDASGKGRMQINDSNWIVVAQSPRPGTRVSSDVTPVLRVLKPGERGDKC